MAFKQKVASATKNKNKKAVQSPKPSMLELDTNDDDDLALKMDEDDSDDDDDEKNDPKQNVLKSKLKQKIGNNQDDDEGDEDDDDDDDDEDSKQNVLKSKSKKKIESNQNSQQVKNKTKKKSASPTQTDGSLTKQNEKNLAIEQKNREIEGKRDAKQLIIKKLPVDITCEELKSLSDDIIHVILPNPDNVKKRSFKTLFAFVVFTSEKKAEKNFGIFQNKKLRGVPIEYDYAGAKSKTLRTTDLAHDAIYDAKKLHISGLPTDFKIQQIAELTPSATSVVVNFSTVISMAFVTFDSEEAAAEALEANKKIEINGKPVYFLYAKTNKKPFKRHLLKERKGTVKSFQHGEQPPLAKRPRQDLDVSSQD